ncbi:hypothetical protein PV768_15840 [Pseudarthrobacter sp. CC4]|uniref:hypothetical protein n=1 Tax=Pseudarthrobacter sp. CC4 TaxID=3029190 RepID=UPI003B8E73CE
MRNSGNTGSGRHVGFARSAAVLTAAAVLILAPGIAQASFTTGATGHMSTATLSLTQPVGTAATSSCTGRDLTITFTNYGYVPRASAFRIEIFRDPADTAPQFVVDKAQNDLSPITVRLSGARTPRPYNVRGLYPTAGGNTWIGQPLPGTTVSC